METTSFNWLTAEPTPTPEAPEAIAIGAVILLNPEAQSTGIDTARLMAWAAARVGDAVAVMVSAPETLLSSLVTVDCTCDKFAESVAAEPTPSPVNL